jgi:hypothetical protein
MAKEDGDIDVSRLVMTGFFKSDHHIGIKALAGVVCVYVSHVVYVYMYRWCAPRMLSPTYQLLILTYQCLRY